MTYVPSGSAHTYKTSGKKSLMSRGTKTTELSVCLQKTKRIEVFSPFCIPMSVSLTPEELYKDKWSSLG